MLNHQKGVLNSETCLVLLNDNYVFYVILILKLLSCRPFGKCEMPENFNHIKAERRGLRGAERVMLRCVVKNKEKEGDTEKEEGG